MIRINALYTDYYDKTDPAYPGGKAVDTSSGDSEDGTPYKASWMNDVNGFHQAAIVEALGAFSVSGQSDRVGASDILNALKIIMNSRISSNVTPEFILARLLTVDGAGSGIDADLFCGKPPEYYLSASFAGFYIKAISGVETIIPWGEFGITYNPEKKYMVFITPQGLFKDYVNFPCEAKEDGLHVYPQKLINGKLKGGTETRKWGTHIWGAGMEYIPGRVWGEYLWGEGEWSASRIITGETWGEYEPMNINIQIKEA